MGTASGRTALVIDDDALARRMMGDALVAEGFDVFTASDGTEGMHSLLDLLLWLDLVVVDLHMPGLDGEQLLRMVREPGGERDLTIVVMSGFLEPEAHLRLSAAGADAVLPKAGGPATIASVAVLALLRRLRSGRRSSSAPSA